MDNGHSELFWREWLEALGGQRGAEPALQRQAMAGAAIMLDKLPQLLLSCLVRQGLPSRQNEEKRQNFREKG